MSEPLIAASFAFLKDQATSKIFDALLGAFRSKVIDRWSKARAEQFFAAFCKQVAQERGLLTDAEVELALEKILSNNTVSEALFEAYRRVALSRSRKLGPRIVGLLVATLVKEDRFATDDEEIILSCAESLGDADLRSYLEFFRSEQAKAPSKEVKLDGSGLHVWLCSEEISSNDSSQASTGQLDLGTYYGGRWARSMASLGVMLQDVQEQQYHHPGDPEYANGDPSQIRQLDWWVLVPAPLFPLADLIERADWNEEEPNAK